MNQPGVVFRHGTFPDVAVAVTVGDSADRFFAFELHFIEFELEFEFGFVDCVADEEECCKK